MITLAHDEKIDAVFFYYQPDKPIGDDTIMAIEYFNSDYELDELGSGWYSEACDDLIYFSIPYSDWGVPYQDDKAGLQMLVNVIKEKSGYIIDLDSQDVIVCTLDEMYKKLEKENNNGN